MKKSLFILAAIMLATTAYATAPKYTFSCAAQNDNNPILSDFMLTLQGNQAIVRTMDEDQTYTGKLNRSYNPRSNTKFVRFNVGFFDEYDSWILVQRTMLNGRSGYAQAQARGETFFTNTYKCTAK